MKAGSDFMRYGRGGVAVGVGELDEVVVVDLAVVGALADLAPAHPVGLDRVLALHPATNV